MKKTLLFIFLFAACLTGAQNIYTLAGKGTMGYTGDNGPATAAELSQPASSAFDHLGNMFICDNANYVVRKVNNGHIINTYAGGGTCPTFFCGDGGPATSAKLKSPRAVACDPNGNVYVVDGNVIRKINSSGIISLFAGDTTNILIQFNPFTMQDDTTIACGYSDNIPAIGAQLCGPTALTFDNAGNCYLSDAGNYRIRKIDQAGIITTIAGDGTSGYSGDGGLATSAQIKQPNGIAVDNQGNVYFADMGNNVIRMIDVFGNINTVAGYGAPGYNGDGIAATTAQLNAPTGVTIDQSGNILIADGSNHRIRIVNNLGIINTISGNNTAGYSGDGGPAASAVLNHPNSVILDNMRRLVVTDDYNSTVRVISPTTPEICMVEVDSFSLYNIVYWNKMYPADTFYVYRDTLNYDYALIAKIPVDSFSTFKDTVRNLCLSPNGDGNPNNNFFRYKLAYRDSISGSMSLLSPFHQTVYMTNPTTGVFNWNLYQIEGETPPVPQVSSYYFEVDSFSVGHYYVVQSLSASSTTYNDFNIYPNPTYRSVAIGFNCNPSLRSGSQNTQGTVVKSRSNVKNNRTTTIEKNKNYPASVFPNPSSGNLFINFPATKKATKVELYNVLGEKVYSEKLNEQNNYLNISKLNSGIYELRITEEEKVIYSEKMIKD